MWPVSFDPCVSPVWCVNYPRFIDEGTTQAQRGPARGHIIEQAAVPELRCRSGRDRVGSWASHCMASASTEHAGEQGKTGCFLQNPIQGMRDIWRERRETKLQTELAY